jgi:hypothetical protein
MSNDAKPTLDLDRLEIIRRLLEKQSTQLENVGSKVDLLDVRFRSIEVTTEATRNDVVRLDGRVKTLEADVRELRERDAGILRQQSDADYQQQAAIGGAIAHVSKLETAVHEQGEALAGLVKSQSAQTATLTKPQHVAHGDDGRLLEKPLLCEGRPARRRRAGRDLRRRLEGPPLGVVVMTFFFIVDVL